jgi:hypothetical protein
MSIANQTKLTPQDLLNMPNGNHYELVDVLPGFTCPVRELFPTTTASS